MRDIDISKIINEMEKLCIEANCYLNNDILDGLQDGVKNEKSPQGREILNSLIENAKIAKEKCMPICQDTGMMIAFVDVGQDVHVTGGLLTDAINEGVRRGYQTGYLRKSIVKDPLRRENTGDNTPAIIHYNIVRGGKIKITAMPKGFGSENMGGVKMLKPSDGIPGVIKFVIDTVNNAGPNPCPPIVVGIGIGGSMEKAAILSKEALKRPINKRNEDKFYCELEQTLLKKINETGIGPQGLGGMVTALGVNIEAFPTHIAGLPVAVTISCHVTRHCSVII